MLCLESTILMVITLHNRPNCDQESWDCIAKLSGSGDHTLHNLLPKWSVRSPNNVMSRKQKTKAVTQMWPPRKKSTSICPNVLLSYHVLLSHWLACCWLSQIFKQLDMLLEPAPNVFDQLVVGFTHDCRRNACCIWSGFLLLTLHRPKNLSPGLR